MMNNRIKNNEKITKRFLAAGMTRIKLHELIKLFDDLEQKIMKGQVPTTADIVFIVKKIHDLSLVNNDGEIDVLKTEVYKLSKNFISLFPHLIQTFKEAIQNQIKLAKADSPKPWRESLAYFTDYLKHTLILPMLFEIAHTTEHSYTSKYVGKIPIITIDGQTINSHALEQLAKFDSYLEENMRHVEKRNGQISSLLAYALTFGYLNKESNKESQLLSIASTKKTFLHYLEETGAYNQLGAARKISPKLMLATNDVMYLFSSYISDDLLLKGALVGKQTILLLIDDNVFVDEFLQSLIHEMQHLYNSLYLDDNDSNNITEDLSTSAINEFIEFSHLVEFKGEGHNGYYALLKNIRTVMENIAHYDQKGRDIDELSAHLTSLLLSYSPYHIRKVINIVIDHFRNQEEALPVAKAISNAFYFVEHAIHHMAIALYQFTVDKTIEEWKIHADKNTIFKKMLRRIKEELKKIEIPIEDYRWDDCLAAVRQIDSAAEEIVNVVSPDNSMYSLHELAKYGNNVLIQALLRITKRNIDALDERRFSPLAYAVMNKHLATVELLHQFGASFYWKGKIAEVKNYTLLHLAARYGNVEIIPTLLKKGLSATALDEKNQVPLLLLAKEIVNSCQNTFVTEKTYKASITALAYLLSESDEQNNKSSNNDPGTNFYHSLLTFRKNVALFYTLHECGALQLFGSRVPSDIILNVSLHISDNIPGESYKNCYRDILLKLLENKNLLIHFITLGMAAAYDDIQVSMKNSINPINVISHKLSKLISLDIKNEQQEPPVSTQEKKDKLISYYSPRSLFMGAESLTAVTLAQRHMQARAASGDNERKLAIKQCKERIARGNDEGLTQAILQACKEMGIKEIDSHIYHQFSALLNKLVIKDKKTPATYTPRMFVSAFKSMYQESAQVSEVNDGVKRITL
jgi:hypothetical protein